MLLMADRYGNVHASLPALASRATVSVSDCEQALAKFLAPDPYSRTLIHDGRRIEAMEGGWHILNYTMYRDMRDEEARKEQNRIAQRKRRSMSAKNADMSSSGADESANLLNVSTRQHPSAQAEAYTDTDTEYLPPTPFQGELEAKAKKAKSPKPLKMPEWSKVLPKEVLSTLTEIKSFWPTPQDGSLQPADRATGRREAVPATSWPALGTRLAEIEAEGARMDVCLAIAHRFVDGYLVPENRVWMKGAQFFFGKRDDAPWRALYRAHITNESLELEEARAQA